MAYVAISNQLIHTTGVNIRGMRDKEKAAYPTVPESGIVPDGDGNITALIWGSYQHLRAQMPDEWKKTPGHVTLRIGYKMLDTDDRTHNVDFQVKAPNGFEVPNINDGNSSYYGYIVKTDESSYLLPQGAKDLVAHRKLCREADQRWADVEAKVRQFLNSAKSLNEALKLWPGLAMYIDKDYIDRVNTKVVAVKKEKPKTNAEELLGSIDVDSLTAAAVASKLTV